MTNEQYFTVNPTSKDQEITFSGELAEKKYQFYSNNGVFSKNYLDFGTRTLVSTVADLELSPKSVLDLGTGYGPIALFAADKFPEAEITASDVNERALALAQRNFAANGFDQIETVESSLFENISTSFDLILTNPPIRAGKKIINALIEESIEHLNDGGHLILVVQRKQGEPSIRAKMTDVFGNCKILKRNKGYYILSACHE
jgi:16S rRNA (guanine1207-N2)-methyltransferase